ncbi:MAG: transglycosylase domain-containing protein, partial [Bacteroidota bacterium]
MLSSKLSLLFASFRRILSPNFFILAGWISLIFLYFSLPQPLFKVPYAAVLTDRNGQLLSARIASDGQWRFPSSVVLSEKYTKALLAFEDKRFYVHRGIDLLAIFSALKYNYYHPENKRG